MAERPRLGLIGIGLMGTGMTLRLLERGWGVAVWNLEPERTRAFLGETQGLRFQGADTLGELVASLERPRCILMMIMAGDPVDQTLAKLAPYLDRGDDNCPLVSNPDGLFGHALVDMMKRGTELIIVDPRATWLASRAKYFLQLHYGIQKDYRNPELMVKDNFYGQ